MKDNKVTLDNILQLDNPSRTQKIRLVLYMSMPAILAQFTSIAMQYIDAAMVGSLGAKATGAIGLVTTSIWLMSGMLIGLSSGFSIQVAQLVGAGRKKEASDILRQALLLLISLNLVITCVCVLCSGRLPVWLGGSEEILADASAYFFIFSLTIPFAGIRQLSASMMQCSGDMKTPSILAAMVCLLDVIFNFLFIFPTRSVSLLGLAVTIPGAGLGVKGAALGTASAEVIISLCMLYAVCVRSEILNLRGGGNWRIRKKVVVTALKIALPLSFDHIFMCTAYIAGTLLIAPLGTVAVAAHTLAVTAESVCYMPGFGIGAAATAIIGQSIGAGRDDLTISFSRVAVITGVILMSFMGFLMYVSAPWVFSFFTSDPSVAALGTHVLRIELLSEPLYAVSMCAAGVFRGAGDTLIPSIMNLASMWGVRITLGYFLIPILGLSGFWTAMLIELCFRGIIFFIRLRSGRWMKKAVI